MKRGGDAVDDSSRSAQLMRGKRYEVALQLIRLFEGFAFLCEEATPFIGEQCKAAEGVEELELFLGEQRGIRARPNDDRALRQLEADAALARLDLLRLEAMRTEHAPPCIEESDGTSSDDVRHVRKDRASHVLRIASEKQLDRKST